MSWFFAIIWLILAAFSVFNGVTTLREGRRGPGVLWLVLAGFQAGLSVQAFAEAASA